MQLRRKFANLRFPESVIRRALAVIDSLPRSEGPAKFSTLSITAGNDEWEYDKVEDFFAAFPGADEATLGYDAPLTSKNWRCILRCMLLRSSTLVTVDSEHLHQINAVMNIFSESLSQATPTEVKAEKAVSESPFSIFIDHGRSKAWEELRNHLQDKHDIR